MPQLLLVLTVLCPLSIPLAAVSQLGRYVSPATLAIMTAIFGALFGVWPRTHRRARWHETPRPAAEPRHWEIRCTTCGQARPLEDVGGLRIGAHSIGKRTIGYCSQCGVMRTMAIESVKTSATGVRASTKSRHEARSQRRLFGLPLYHIVRGPDPATGEVPVAVGVLAIGPVAKGLLAIGGRTFGGIAIGGVSTGVLAVGGVTFGLISIGGVAIALLAALGGCAIAPLAFGGLAVGLSAVGGMAVGKEAFGGSILKGTLPLGAFSYSLRQAAVLTVIGIAVMAFLVLLMASAARGPVGSEEKSEPNWARRVFWLIFLILVLPILVVATALVVPYWMARRTPPSMTEYQRFATVELVTPAQRPSVAHWAQGSVELVGVTRHPAGMSPWWAMDGSPCPEGPFAHTGQRVEEFPGESAYEFVFHLRDLPAGASTPVWAVQDYTRSAGGGIPALVKAPEQPLPGYLTIAAALPDAVTKANIKIGIAAEPWVTVSASHPASSLGQTRRIHDIEWKVIHGAGVDTKKGMTTTFQYRTQPGWEQRVAAFDQAGKELGRGRLSKIDDLATFEFEGVFLPQVAELRYQVRPIRWVEFQGIALAPAETAAAPIRLEIEDNIVRLARQKLDDIKKRVEVGLGTPIDVAEAERDLAIVEARGDAKTIANVRLRYAQEYVTMARARVEAGLITSEELTAAEKELLEAQLAVEKAGPQ